MEKTLCSLKCRPCPRATPLPPVEEVGGGGQGTDDNQFQTTHHAVTRFSRNSQN